VTNSLAAVVPATASAALNASLHSVYIPKCRFDPALFITCDLIKFRLTYNDFRSEFFLWLFGHNC